MIFFRLAFLVWLSCMGLQAQTFARRLDGSFTGFSGPASGRVYLGCSVTLKSSVPFYYRKLGASSWVYVSTPERVLFSWNPSASLYGFNVVSVWSGVSSRSSFGFSSPRLFQSYEYKFPSSSLVAGRFDLELPSFSGVVSYRFGAPAIQNFHLPDIFVLIPSSSSGVPMVSNANLLPVYAPAVPLVPPAFPSAPVCWLVLGSLHAVGVCWFLNGILLP